MKETSKKSLQIEKTEKCFPDLGFVTKPMFSKILAIVCHLVLVRVRVEDLPAS